MGEVINISRVSDLDIFSEFDSQCPAIPEDIDAIIRLSAEKAVEKRQSADGTGSFGVTCALVVLISILALAGVKFVANQVVSNFSSKQFSNSISTLDYQWRESRESWQAYINQLNNDPLVVHLKTEQELFQQQFSD